MGRRPGRDGPVTATQARGPVFASEDPKVFVAVADDWCPYLARVTEWGWGCTCGEARRRLRLVVPAAENADDHFHWHQRVGRA
jgi:hypothetical protein